MNERLALGGTAGCPPSPASGEAAAEAAGSGPVSATTIYVCTRCRAPATERADEPPGGESLLAALDAAARAVGRETGGTAGTGRIDVRGVACLSNCNRPCTVAFVGPGKLAYVYGDLGTGVEDAAAAIAMAGLYAASANGITVWRERPERFRRGLIARIPPFGFHGEPVVDGTDKAV